MIKKKNIQLSVTITLYNDDYEYSLSIKYNHNIEYNQFIIESEILKINNEIIINTDNSLHLTIFKIKENIKVSKFISFINNIISIHSLVVVDKNNIVDTSNGQSVKLYNYNFLNWFYYEFSIMPKVYINLLTLSNNIFLDYKFNIIDKYKK